jgi:hypothetical protein
VKLRHPVDRSSSCSPAAPAGNIEQGGIYTVRSACPQVAIPAATGDITLFDPGGSTDASAIDVVATITNLRANCQESGSDMVSTATFDVVAVRRDAGQARQVVLPFFDVVVQAGNRSSPSGRPGGLNFAAGSIAAQTAQATGRVNLAAGGHASGECPRGPYPPAQGRRRRTRRSTR